MIKINKKIRFAFLMLFIAVSSGCTGVISEQIRNETDTSLSFGQILRDVNSYKGRTVIWGGEIIKTEIQKDGTALIEVYERPLRINDAPDLSCASEGRFLIYSAEYLDPYIYKTGRKITVGGKISGEEIRRIGEMDYHYPLVISKEIYVWSESRYYDVSPYFFYEEPWWGYPSWGHPYYGWPLYIPHHHHPHG